MHYKMTDFDYEYERYLATPDNVKQVLNYYGVAIIPNILNEEECDAMNNGMWDTLEHITQTWAKPKSATILKVGAVCSSCILNIRCFYSIGV